MARYRKFHSKYSLDQKHRHLDNGDIIWEKDWSTVRGPIVGNFGPNSIKKFTEGNFTFVNSNIPSPSKKHVLTNNYEVFSYDKVSNKQRKNTISDKLPTYNSSDLRDYAYYGSAVELIRTTIESIITNFPSKSYTSGTTLTIMPLEGIEKDTYYNSERFILHNPYKVDFVTERPTVEDVPNIMRYMSLSYPYFKVVKYGEASDICEYTIAKYDIIQNYNGVLDYCNEQYDYQYTMFDNTEPIYLVRLTLEPYCNDNNNNDTENISKDVDNCKKNDNSTDNSNINDENENLNCNLTELFIGAYRAGQEWLYVTYNDKISIEATDDVFEDYFNNLQGFEKQLLNRNTRPIYTNTFLTPSGDEQETVWSKKKYIFPTLYDPNTEDHSSKYISLDDTAYYSFLSELITLAETLDTFFVDNIWQKMTHESIKNFDWSWKYDPTNPDYSDYGIEGGERMHNVMRIIGRAFDDVKFNISHIKNLNKVTYDNETNTSNVKLTEISEHLGWEVPSIKDLLFNTETPFDVTLDKKWLENKENGIEKYGWRYNSDECLSFCNYPKWYPTVEPTSITPEYCDIEFKRRLALSAKHIMRHKGTKRSIEMINAIFGIGENELSITNEVQTLNQLKVVTPEEIERIKSLLSYAFTKDNGSEFPNIPLKSVSYKIDGDYHYFLIPYFDNNAIYDGDLMYQGNGGWGMIDGSNEYEETLAYMKRLDTTYSLTDTNPFELLGDDVFYVSSLSGYKYNVPFTSNYFIIPYTNVGLCDIIESWCNIPFKIDSITQEYIELSYEEFIEYVKNVNEIFNYPDKPISYDQNEDGYAVYLKNYNRIKYLSKVVSRNDGNNPHTGYGNYDFGEKYFQYMRNPLKYFEENSNMIDEDYLEELKSLIFDLDSDGNIIEYKISDKKFDNPNDYEGEYDEYDNFDENIRITINY